MKPLRIAVDVGCTRGKRAGIGWYAINLLSELAKVDTESTYLLYTFYSRSREYRFDHSGLPTEPNVQLHQKWIPHRVARFLLGAAGLRIESLLGPVDVFHSFDYSAPPLASARLVVTIHDLSFLIYPELAYRSATPEQLTLQAIRDLAHRADAVIAVSRSTRNDIERVLGVPGDRIRVVHEAAESRFTVLTSATHLDQVRERYSLPTEFILFVGTIEPRKNIAVLLRAFNELQKTHGVLHKLVLVGRLGWSYQDALDVLKELELEDDVLLLGHVLQDDLPALYNLASLFVYPSLYEGFGLPPLEAMACGTPVIASSNSCFPEVLGDAAILVDAADVSAFAVNMALLLTDGALRADYVERGLARAASYSWSRAAAETAAIYREVVQQ